MPDARKATEDALGRAAKDLLDNPLVTGSISRLMELREHAVEAQAALMSALNVPSASDIERLTRRVRSVSQRLEGIEDSVDRLAEAQRPEDIARKLAAIEAQLAEIAASLPATAEVS